VRREGQDTIELEEFIKSCFDSDGVVMKEVGGLKVGWEYNVRRVA